MTSTIGWFAKRVRLTGEEEQKEGPGKSCECDGRKRGASPKIAERRGAAPRLIISNGSPTFSAFLRGHRTRDNLYPRRGTRASVRKSEKIDAPFAEGKGGSDDSGRRSINRREVTPLPFDIFFRFSPAPDSSRRPVRRATPVRLECCPNPNGRSGRSGRKSTTRLLGTFFKAVRCLAHIGGIIASSRSRQGSGTGDNYIIGECNNNRRYFVITQMLFNSSMQISITSSRIHFTRDLP